MIRLKIKDYTFFVINKEFNIIDIPYDNSLIIGREIDKKEPLKILLSINMRIMNQNIKKYAPEEENFKRAILELAIYNEYATRMTKRSCYQRIFSKRHGHPFFDGQRI